MGFSNMKMAAAKSMPKSTMGIWAILEDGPDAHGFLEHDDGCGQVHAKVNHGPVNALLDVFFLLNDEHVVVEELLQLLVDKVDGVLLEAVVLKDLEAGNVEHSTEVSFLQSGINKSVVAFLDQPLEEAIEDSTSNATNGSGGLVASLTLGDPFSADLDPGLAEDLDHLEGVDHEGTCCLAREGVGSDELALSLVVSALCLELNPTAGHHTSSQHVAIKLFLVGESQNVKGVFSVEKLLVVINGINLCLSLGDVDVVIDVAANETLCAESFGANLVAVGLEQLVEDVVGPLHLLLLSD